MLVVDLSRSQERFGTVRAVQTRRLLAEIGAT